jgi:hypothetical protein
VKYVVAVSLVIVGIIHLLPLSGVIGGERLSALYGLSLNEPNIAILMRHRAILFGILGVFFLAAVFKQGFQPYAFGVGFVSVLSFIGLAWATGSYNEQIARVVTADLIALAALIIGSIALGYQTLKA